MESKWTFGFTQDTNYDSESPVFVFDPIQPKLLHMQTFLLFKVCHLTSVTSVKTAYLLIQFLLQSVSQFHFTCTKPQYGPSGNKVNVSTLPYCKPNCKEEWYKGVQSSTAESIRSSMMNVLFLYRSQFCTAWWQSQLNYSSTKLWLHSSYGSSVIATTHSGVSKPVL